MHKCVKFTRAEQCPLTPALVKVQGRQSRSGNDVITTYKCCTRLYVIIMDVFLNFGKQTLFYLYVIIVNDRAEIESREMQGDCSIIKIKKNNEIYSVSIYIYNLHIIVSGYIICTFSFSGIMTPFAMATPH